MEKVTRKSEREMMEAKHRDWENSTATELYHVYTKFSSAKAKAMEYCRNLMYALNGSGLRIISFNDQTFSVGFEYPDPETGAMCFAYITKAHDRCIEL